MARKKKDSATGMIDGGLAVLETGQPLLPDGPENESPRQYEKRCQKFNERYGEWAAQSTQERTQYVADGRFEGERVYRCWHEEVKIDNLGNETYVKDKVFPVVTIKADNEYEAQERYKEVSGIKATSHRIASVELDAKGQPVPQVVEPDEPEDE